MGFSATLFQKEFMEFSLEISKDISLEMSTGFGSSDRVTAHINMPLSISDLAHVIKELTTLHASLLKAWKCPECGELNAEAQEEEAESQCSCCDFKKVTS